MQTHLPLDSFPFSKMLSSLAIPSKVGRLISSFSSFRLPVMSDDDEIAALDGLTVTESSFDEWAATSFGFNGNLDEVAEVRWST